MILITGATGTIGSHVLRLLSAGSQPVRAMTRNPSSIQTAPGVEVVQADFDDPASLARATAGVTTVFLLTAPTSPTSHHDLAMLEAARSAGVARVVRLSAIGTGEHLDNGQTVGAWHLQADRAVQTSGMAWTLLRPSSFASNLLQLAGLISAGAPVPNTTGSARQGIIDPRDVAAVAARVLTSPDHDGQTLTLTGPELLSVPEQAAILEQVLGRPVTTVDLPPDAARAQLLSSGTDPAVVDGIITGVTWARAGHNTILTGDVASILGRPPASFQTWAHDHREVFEATP